MKNILIIRFSSLGDLVTLEPTFKAIRDFYKNDKITLMTTKIGKELYKDSNYFDDYIVEKTLLKQIGATKNQKFDIIFNLQCNRESHIIIFFTKYDILINKSYTAFEKFFGLKATEYDLKTMLLKSGVNKSDIEKYIKSDRKIELPFSKSQKIDDQIDKKFQNKKLIAISIGTSQKWVSKRWGRDNFLKLIQKLSKDFGVILIGSKLEKKDSLYIENKTKNILNLVDTTSLQELKYLLKRVDLYIGNDSGPTHIAAAVGTDTLTIFTSTDKKHSPKFGNYRGKHKLLTPPKEIECHPCYKAKCPKEMECAKSIKAKDVFALAKEMLDG